MAVSEAPGATNAGFFVRAIQEFRADANVSGLRILDFGCGDGAMVRELRQYGLDALGCDIPLGAHGPLHGVRDDLDHIRVISMSPYRLPFADGEFDVVVSSSVLEHAQNTEECYREIHRVLRPGGISLHLFPGKWHLPTEPHLGVPLLNWYWPRRGRWWLALWARLGVRNEFQSGKSWREVLELNDTYCKVGLSWRSSRFHSRLSRKVFDSYQWPMEFYVAFAPGGAARLARRLPLHWLGGLACREFRQALLLQRKGAG